MIRYQFILLAGLILSNSLFAVTIEDVTHEQEEQDVFNTNNTSSGFPYFKKLWQFAQPVNNYINSKPLLQKGLPVVSALTICGALYAKSSRVRKFVESQLDNTQDLFLERVAIPAYEKYDDIQELGFKKAVTVEDWAYCTGIITGISGLCLAQHKYSIFNKVADSFDILKVYATEALNYTAQKIGEHPKAALCTGFGIATVATLAKIMHLKSMDSQFYKDYSLTYFLQRLSYDQKERLAKSSEYLSVVPQAQQNPLLLDITAFKKVLTKEQKMQFKKLLAYYKQQKNLHALPI